MSSLESTPSESAPSDAAGANPGTPNPGVSGPFGAKVGVRVAIAGERSLVRNAHFGHAEYFDVFDVGADPPVLLERRFTAPFCGPQSTGGWSPKPAAEIVADCVAVFAARIGPCARQDLAAVDVIPVEHLGPRFGGAQGILTALRTGRYRRGRASEPPARKLSTSARENQR